MKTNHQFHTDEPERFGILVHHLRIGLIRHLEQELASNELGLNFSQFRVLRVLAQVDHISASELARRIDHDAGALTRMLDRLQEKGYVQRHTCPDDRRSVQIALTDAGRALAKPLCEIGDRLHALALSELNSDEQKTLMALLARVRVTLDR